MADLDPIDRWYSELLDVHVWSHHPEIRELTNTLYDELSIGRLESKSNNKGKISLKGMLRVLLLDLYVRWLKDPNLATGFNKATRHYKPNSRNNAPHINRNIIPIEKELEEELRYAVASAKGIVPADAVIKIERKLGRPTGGLSQESKKAGGKKSRIKRGQTYKPTDDDYSKVEEMVTIGLDQHTIAKVMGISNATLTKYYMHNLLVGKDKRTARVAGVAYEMAVSGESPSMTTFWLKTQAGWNSKHHVVVEDRQFDIQWAANETDIADANQTVQILRNKDDKVH